MSAQPAESARLSLPTHAENDLAHIKALRKFGSDGALYSGIADPERRRLAEMVINLTIETIAVGLKDHPAKSFVLEQFKKGLFLLDKAGLSDTEDRERAATYLEQVMDTVGLDSSDDLLNTWVYGFDPSKQSLPT